MDQHMAAYMPTLLIVVTLVVGIIGSNYRIRHLDTRIGDLIDLTKAEIGRSEAVLRGEITALRADVRADLAELRGELAAVRADIATLVHR